MIIALLPLGHFLLGVLSLLWQRGARRLLPFALLVDALLIGSLWARVAGGTSVSIVLGGWGRDLGIELMADKISVGFSFLAILLTLAVTVYLWRERLRPYFYVLLHFLLASVFALVFARDLFNIYVIVEILTLVSFLLVGYERKPQQIWASLNYLILAALGMAMYLFGVGIIYYHTGTLNLTLLVERVAGMQDQLWLITASTLLVVGVSIKAGIFVFSLWLPAAHASASPAVSALLSGLVIKMGVVVLLRLSTVLDISLPLIVTGALTGIVGAVYAMFTYELKRMLAFHSLSQVGYLLIGIGIGTPLAIAGSLTYAVAHGLFKGLLFLAAGQVVNTTGSAFIPQQIALRDKIPRATRMALLVGTLAIAGLPPLAGFCAKGLLSASTYSLSIHLLLVFVSLGTVISFSKLIPLLDPRHGGVGNEAKTISYSILAVPIIAFLPLSFLLVPQGQVLSSLGLLQAGESVAIIGAGFLVYLVLRGHPVHLSQRIFRLEEAILTILSMFFVVFLLLAAL
ncbi:MAG: proton-conducting transporter membrane subunit [Candidatus Bipolaricaulota bacterium]|nr:proton-conducting transporter membrane subunit [Candidatus Bipolaricaulota bacterium]